MVNQETGQEVDERILFMNGVIAEESWFDDDVTPALFKDELNAGTGDITLWINSPGGDCVAAAQIFNMLSEYPGKVTVKIDGLAASAASVIAMAGTEVWMSPVSMMMIHNPATVAWGDHSEMKKAMELLDAVKESIINAYVRKTGQSRAKLSHLMDAETWISFPVCGLGLRHCSQRLSLQFLLSLWERGMGSEQRLWLYGMRFLHFWVLSGMGLSLSLRM